jgi:ketosteroid isomerase-like protein
MESTPNPPEAAAKAFIRAINRQDVDALGALMSPSHRFVDSLGNLVEGQDALRKGWTAYFAMVPDYTLAIEETYALGPVVVMLGIAQGTYSKDEQLPPQNRWQTPIAVRAHIDEGKVAEWRVYADNDPIRKLMANCE